MQSKETSLEKWDKVAEDKLMSRILKDSLAAAIKGEPRKKKDPFREILKNKK